SGAQARRVALPLERSDPRPWLVAHREGLRVSEPLEPGREIQGWIVERPLGHGATSEVFLVEHRSSGLRGALKILQRKQAAAEEVQRFTREAKVLSKLDHPGIVPVIDSGITDDA